jgi:hypothetical protein
VELKVGKFLPQYVGQMDFYLKWLNRHERREDENEPIGLILCTKASRNQIELMKLKAILLEACERLGRRMPIHKGAAQKQIEYFHESEDELDAD